MPFLTNASDDDLLRAVAANHTAWFARQAAAGGGQEFRAPGMRWTHQREPSGSITILFPRLKQARASEALEELLAFARSHGVRGASCWSLLPAVPRDLGARLVARGFEWGWQPHWMALDLAAMADGHAVPPGFTVEEGDGSPLRVGGLPYADPESAPVMQAVLRLRPQRVWQFVARLDGRVVGQSAVNVTTGRLGIGGIFNCGVVAEARNRGIGTAVTAAACRKAREIGCRYALLNATPLGERIYRRLGFRSLGHGQTWWMHRPALAAPPPARERVLLAEAVGRGDRRALNALAPALGVGALDEPLPSGMTLMELAVKMEQPASAGWLAAHGVTLDVLSAWDLGWKDRVPELLAHNPALANFRSGPWGGGPLHEAALRGDLELARVLLSANPDLEMKDRHYHGTPLGWARHLDQPEIARLLEDPPRAREPGV